MNLRAEDMIASMNIAKQVALFLLNSDRIQEAIEICNECLALLNNTNQNSKDQIEKFYSVLFSAYRRISDYVSAKRYGRKLLVLYSESGDLVKEGDLSMALAEIFESQNRFTDAKELYEKAVNIRRKTDKKTGEANACERLGTTYYKLGENLKGKEYVERALVIRNELGDRRGKASFYEDLGNVFRSLGKYSQAKECLQKALAMISDIGDERREASCYENLGSVLESLGQYDKAEEYLRKALHISTQIGDRRGEASCYGNLGNVFESFGQYSKAEEYLKKALVIRIKICDRKGEAADYGNLGTVFQSLGQYDKAKEYLQKALVITTEIGDREGEAANYGNLGTVFWSLGKFDKAKLYLQKALDIRTEIGNRGGKVANYRDLGTVYMSLGQYDEAELYLQTALVISTEIGDRKGEASSYGNLGNVFKCLGHYDKAKEYLQKGFLIRTEIGDRKGEASDYGNLGAVFQSLGQYHKAKRCLKTALDIKSEIGDKKGKASCYGNLGSVFESLGQYGEAEEYLKKALDIRTEIGDEEGKATDYGNLGTVFRSLGQYDKAREYFQKALDIRTEIGNRGGEAADYGNLGTVFQSLGQYGKAIEYLNKALVISTEIGDRKREAVDYGNLGTVFQSLGQYDKAKDYLQMALVIRTEIGDKEGEAADLTNLGIVSRTVGDYKVSEECLEKALFISRDIGDIRRAFQILLECAILYLFQNEIKDSLSCLRQCIGMYEELRYSLGANDEFKTSFLEDSGIFPYKLLSRLLCDTGNVHDALYVEELGRARGLSDLMAEKYSVQTHISANLKSWFSIEAFFRKNNNCICLYISYFQNQLHLWILKRSGVPHYKRISPEENMVQAGSPRGLPLSEFLDVNFRSLGILSSLCYKMFIAPVYDLLEEPEIIIVPDPRLHKVPFAALREREGAEYLSETHRIRVIPSLTTLKIIQNSPEDYHSNTGALVIGNPKIDWLQPLPYARREAEMVARLVGVPPLVEEEATKQAVLERITSVSLIHFAAHGSVERGEIALSPTPIPNSRNAISEREDCVLTMTDVSRVKIRAKLVVLSCCHSGSGQKRAEGVIGIARAFLGSGARSVLVALWAIPDFATEQLMSRFYQHLVEGESVSESLHQAMKWMRRSSFSEVSEWAPFTLIGDDVRFEFGA